MAVGLGRDPKHGVKEVAYFTDATADIVTKDGIGYAKTGATHTDFVNYPDEPVTANNNRLTQTDHGSSAYYGVKAYGNDTKRFQFNWANAARTYGYFNQVVDAQYYQYNARFGAHTQGGTSSPNSISFQSQAQTPVSNNYRYGPGRWLNLTFRGHATGSYNARMINYEGNGTVSTHRNYSWTGGNGTMAYSGTNNNFLPSHPSWNQSTGMLDWLNCMDQNAQAVGESSGAYMYYLYNKATDTIYVWEVDAVTLSSSTYKGSYSFARPSSVTAAYTYWMHHGNTFYTGSANVPSQTGCVYFGVYEENGSGSGWDGNGYYIHKIPLTGTYSTGKTWSAGLSGSGTRLCKNWHANLQAQVGTVGGSTLYSSYQNTCYSHYDSTYGDVFFTIGYGGVYNGGLAFIQQNTWGGTTTSTFGTNVLPTYYRIK